MLTTIRRRLWRERRRILLLTAMFLGIDLLKGGSFIADPLGLGLPHLSGIEVTSYWLPLTLVAILTLQFLRSSAEVFVLSQLIMQVIDGWDQQTLFWQILPFQLDRTLAWGIILGLIYAGYQTALTDRFHIRPVRLTARVKSTAAPLRLWDGLIGSPDSKDRVQPNLELSWAGADKTSWKVISRQRNGASITYNFKVEEMDRPKTATLTWEVEGADPDYYAATGTVSLRTIRTEPDTVIAVTETANNASLRLRLLRWIDDELGRRMDGQVAWIEKNPPVAEVFS